MKGIHKVSEEYEKYQEKTEIGIQCKIARYWLGFISMVQLYYHFIRSIRTGDSELYIFCLERLSDHCFPFNQPNYARWLVLYHNNPLKLKNTLPQIHKGFLKGCFLLKETENYFSRLPIDLTLEQTIKTNALCQRNGILAITSSIDPRQRWA